MAIFWQEKQNETLRHNHNGYAEGLAD